MKNEFKQELAGNQQELWNKNWLHKLLLDCDYDVINADSLFGDY